MDVPLGDDEVVAVGHLRDFAHLGHAVRIAARQPPGGIGHVPDAGIDQRWGRTRPPHAIHSRCGLALPEPRRSLPCPPDHGRSSRAGDSPAPCPAAAGAVTAPR
jgi:hypothetical protein